MDIELSLRELLVLENPGQRFTDAVLARVGTMPAGLPRDGVVRLADARTRRRKRVVLIALLAVAAAASMMPWFRHATRYAPVAPQSTAALIDRRDTVDAIPSARLPVAAGPASPDGAHDPLDCVDPDVMRGLLMQLPSENFRMSAAVPSELADFKPPRQLQLVGVSERGTGARVMSSVVYSSALDPDGARNIAVGALAASGWKAQSSNNPLYSAPFATNVFTAVVYRTGDSYCRGGEAVNVAASALDGATYVVLSVTHDSNRMTGVINICDQPASLVARPVPALDKYMPKLELPRDPGTGQPPRSQGGGGGNGEAERRMSVIFYTRSTAVDVATELARQMTAQGWRADASWSGTGSAGSSWSRSGDDDKVLQGTLVVSAFDDGRFSASFHVVATK